MKYSLPDIAAKAADSARGPMTALLRHNVSATGWPSDVVRSLRVKTEGTKVWVESSNEEAASLEYGDGENRPSAAVRNFTNRTEPLEAAIIKAAEARLEGIL